MDIFSKLTVEELRRVEEIMLATREEIRLQTENGGSIDPVSIFNKVEAEDLERYGVASPNIFEVMNRSSSTQGNN